MILFRPVTSDDFPLLLTWLAKPHVRAWWDDGDDTLDKVVRHYGPDAETERFLICLQTPESALAVPAGYIQSYQMDGNGIGLDLFLGEEILINQGIGTRVLLAFIPLQTARHHPAYFLVDPEPDNRQAIRCYEKAGFYYTETILTEEGKFAYIMRLDI